MKSKRPRFLRTDWWRRARLGKGRKKLQKWRKAKGETNKIRLKRFGYPRKPGVGYKTNRQEYGKIMGMIPVLVHNIDELDKVAKNQIVIIAKVGARKKIDIIKRAEEKGIKIYNLGAKK